MIGFEHLLRLLDPLVSAGWLLSGLFTRRWWQAALGAAAWSQVVYVLMRRYLPEPGEQFDPLFAAGTAALYAIAALAVFGLKRRVIGRN